MDIYHAILISTVFLLVIYIVLIHNKIDSLNSSIERFATNVGISHQPIGSLNTSNPPKAKSAVQNKSVNYLEKKLSFSQERCKLLQEQNDLLNEKVKLLKDNIKDMGVPSGK